MNDPHDDPSLGRALRVGLTARDQATRAPSFHDVWPRASRPALPLWRKAVAASAAALVAAALVPFWIWGVPGLGLQRAAPRIDAALVHELSSSDFWRVPSDELLAFDAPPLSASFSAPSAYEVSLEDSLL